MRSASDALCYHEHHLICSPEQADRLLEALAAIEFSQLAIFDTDQPTVQVVLYSGADGQLSAAVEACLLAQGLQAPAGRPEDLRRVLPASAVQLAAGWWIVSDPAQSIPPGCQRLLLPTGTAFGDGHHPSTRLAAELLLGELRPGQGLLDLGCGSGVLGVLAARLGARVLLTDLEAAAVQASLELASANGVAERCQVRQGDLLQAVPAAYRCDIVCSNIYGELVAQMLADPDLRRICPRGPLIWSGIAVNRLDEVERACAAAGEAIIEHRHEGHWHALLCRPQAAL